VFLFNQFGFDSRDLLLLEAGHVADWTDDHFGGSGHVRNLI